MIQLPRLSSVKVTNTKPRCLYCYFNLGIRLIFKGEAYNTPCYSSPNLPLITIIYGLIMHQVLRLTKL
jgi:hypothetical protein